MLHLLLPSTATTTELCIGMYSSLDLFTWPSGIDHLLYKEDIFTSPLRRNCFLYNLDRDEE